MNSDFCASSDLSLYSILILACHFVRTPFSEFIVSFKIYRFYLDKCKRGSYIQTEPKAIKVVRFVIFPFQFDRSTFVVVVLGLVWLLFVCLFVSWVAGKNGEWGKKWLQGILKISRIRSYQTYVQRRSQREQIRVVQQRLNCSNYGIGSLRFSTFKFKEEMHKKRVIIIKNTCDGEN